VIAGKWDRDVLAVTGPDAASYLQGQVSADLTALTVGQSTLALLLAPNGKMEALLRLWRTGATEFLIDTDAGHGAAVAERLKRFLLRTDASVEALDWQCLALRSEAPAPHVHDPDEVDSRISAMSELAGDTGAELVGLCMWPGVDGLDLLGPQVRLPDSVPAVGAEVLEALRIRAGWPQQGSEITESTIPAEIGSWLITAAVSFTKGCYVGQELTARVDSRGGNVPRNLTTLVFGPDMAELVSVGTELFDPAAPDGARPGAVVTSAATDPASGERVALAFVGRSVERPEMLAPRN
jgi:folate-binding protein YgfZ